MNSLVSFSLIAVASAFTGSQLEKLPNVQAPLKNEACPSVSILTGECQTSNPALNTVTISQNSSQDFIPTYAPRQQPAPANSPWTFLPECYTSENTTTPYCVFSHHGFAGGRGISIVTTQNDAIRILHKPAFAQPAVLEGVNNYENPPYTEHYFPGKGRGLVANKTLQRGDQIFASTPILIMDPGAYKLAEEDRLKLAHSAVHNLPEARKPAFWNLLDHFKGDPVDDRINTNAFDVGINGKSIHVVFPEISNLNHDCRPNAAYFFDEETLTHYVHATQPIHPGEEITITYIMNTMTRAQRVGALQRNWGFQCGCSTCRANPSFTKESDARLAQIVELEKKMDDWSLDSEATPQMGEALIDLMKQERLDGSLGVAYRLAAMAYSAIGDRWNAIKHARMSVEYLILDRGFDADEVWAMKQLAEEPEMQWSWKKRVDVRGGCGCGRH